jgi:hypothetical protein
VLPAVILVMHERRDWQAPGGDLIPDPPERRGQ